MILGNSPEPMPREGRQIAGAITLLNPPPKPTLMEIYFYFPLEDLTALFFKGSMGLLVFTVILDILGLL